MAAAVKQMPDAWAITVRAALQARISKDSSGCPFCAGRDWDIEAVEVTVPVRSAPAFGIQCCASICRGCGYVALHSLAALGIDQPMGHF